MQTIILGLLAETFIHPGSGRTGGAIDLPVAREAATDYPYMAGSSLKGALRDQYEQKFSKGEADILFGKSDNAGQVLVSDARLLLLPVRSMTSAYKWATCRHLLERYARDLIRCGLSAGSPQIATLEAKSYLGAGGSDKKLYLEERSFQHAGGLPDWLAELVGQLIQHQTTKDRLPGQMVILPDNDFAWFARYGLAVQARNKLEENKTSNNLWYEESIPPDTLMYTLLAGRQADTLTAIQKIFDECAYLQAGGNETVGQGWFAVRKFYAKKEQTNV
jgi:CRISPR-associated protein Cmr4